MSFFPQLQELDRDGALEETAEAAMEATGHSRGTFLKRGALTAGVVVAGGAFAGGIPAMARGAGVPASDIAILNFALTLEYLEAEFYTQAEKANFAGAPGTFARIVGRHERTHVAFLKGVLGAKAVAKPQFDFKDTVTNLDKFVLTANVLEDTGVHAYLGQVGNIKAKPVLIGAGRILPVEARHAAWIRDIRFTGQKVEGAPAEAAVVPAPAAFEDPFSMAKILAAVKATGFIVG